MHLSQYVFVVTDKTVSYLIWQNKVQQKFEESYIAKDTGIFCEWIVNT